MLVQVAGILDAEEASMLLESGVDLLGFPLGPGIRTRELTLDQAIEIVKKADCSDRAVLITYLDTAPAIVAYAAALGATTVQLHGPIARKEAETLRATSPLRIFKSIVVTGAGPAAAAALAGEVHEFAPLVDYFLIDSYDPATGARGATGKTHDWSVSRKLVEVSPKPMILAGGLNAENVKSAILAVGPAGVDVHTGLEDRAGRKCPVKTRRFVEEVRRVTEAP